MNYTRPWSDKDDKPEDWLKSALAFAGALGYLLKDKEGIIIKAKNDLKELFDCETLVVFNKNNQINIHKSDNDLPDGQLVWVDD